MSRIHDGARQQYLAGIERPNAGLGREKQKDRVSGPARRKSLHPPPRAPSLLFGRNEDTPTKRLRELQGANQTATRLPHEHGIARVPRTSALAKWEQMKLSAPVTRRRLPPSVAASREGSTAIIDAHGN